MVIRFECSSCAQPIEVDGEWASKAVACPYCRNTVTAPAESTLTDLSQIPLASPVVTAEAAPPREAPLYAAVSPAQHGNRLAIVAFALACCLVVLVVVTHLVIAPHRLEVEDFAKSIMSAGNYSEVLEAQSEFLKARGGVPSWMVAYVVLEVAGGPIWIAVIVCGLIAIRRPQRRGFAVAALVMAGLVPVAICCGGGAFFTGA